MTLPEVMTFGCRLNSYESEIMQQHAQAAGLTDAVIVNTCTVTAEAERQARQSIRRQHREQPGKKIIVTGCASHINRASFEAMPEVDHIIANDRKTEAEVFAELAGSEDCTNPLPLAGRVRVGGPQQDRTYKPRVQSMLMAPPPNLPREGGGTLPPPRQNGDLQRAFVQVQNGCDHRCTFCIIPFGRGVSRSITTEKIIEQTRAQVEQGYHEVVFTGVDIASYGKDLPDQPRLGRMIRDVLKAIPELPRLRLSSLDPAAVDDDLWHLIAGEPRFMPHLHLSVQAGDDMVLKRMKRRHARRDVIDLCRRARHLRPDIAFGADFIAGFPTESDAMFENTMRLVEECEITWLHVFPYSSRAGTPAAKMPQVNGAIRRERAERLRVLGDKAAAKHMAALVSQKFDVLVEQQGVGCTRQFAKVKLVGDAPLGEIVGVECAAIENAQAVAKLQ